MTPASLPGIASFSFSGPASQSGSQPPSALVLGSARACSLTGKSPGSFVTAFLTLPKMLVYQIKFFLSDKESLQLLLTSRHMQNDVQSYYIKHLRPEAQRALSPIASFQNSPNLLPRYLGLRVEGELTFQQCQALKVPGMTDADYCDTVLQFLKTSLSEYATSAGVHG